MTPDEERAAEVAIGNALAEDLGSPPFDLASSALDRTSVVARLVTREACTVCGIDLAQPLFAATAALLETGAVAVIPSAEDGDQVTAGSTIATIEGDVRTLLAGERNLLNLMQRLSATATTTRAFVDAVAGTDTDILDTRKTTPGMRHLQRYAVRCGGGVNHRFGLFDVAMIKDNHIDAAGSVTAAVERVREAHPDAMLVVEVRDFEELIAAMPFAPRVVLLDNMDEVMLTMCATTIRRQAKNTGVEIYSEASGGITLETVRRVADCGVDRISVGALTHSAGAIDLAIDVDRA